MAAPDPREALEEIRILDDALRNTPNSQELKLLLDKCTDELNNMSSALIQFSVAWIALKNLLDTQDHPTLFDKEKT
jgi:hypothetical protein